MKANNLKIFILFLVLVYFIPTLLFSQVDTAWVRRYNGPANDSDLAVAIVRDNSGNIYVAGSSISDTTFADYTLIKYDGEGNRLWERRYDHKIPKESDDYANAVAVDRHGNVYVTGKVTLSNQSYSITVKYDANGNKLWARKYPGWSNDIAVDNLGDVYITGAVGDTWFTIKYDTDGNEVWIRKFYDFQLEAFGKALAVDESSNVYVIGQISYFYGGRNYWNWITLKYDKNGNRIWEIGHPTNSSPADIIVDNEGNVYEVGTVYMRMTTIYYHWYLTVKYAAGGGGWRREYWQPYRYNTTTAIGVDNLGNVYVTGQSNGARGGCLTIKYDRDGNELWVRQGPIDNMYGAYRILADNNGNVYIMSNARGSITGYDFLIVKYDSLGNELWIRTYHGGYGEDIANDMALDKEGNVYVVGKSYSSNTSFDYAVVKYDSLGNLLWVRRYDGFQSTDEAKALVVDNNGNICVTGNSSGISLDYVTIKYDKDGNELWRRREGDTLLFPSRGYVSAMKIDNLGNIYLTGTIYESGASSFDYLTVKYDADGNLLWAKRYDGQYGDSASALAIDNMGNIYVTGKSYALSSEYDYLTIKYDQNGNELWIRRYNTPENGRDEAVALVLDNLGNIYVTGRTSSFSDPFYDIVTIKYDPDGNQLWVRRYNSPENHHDEPSDIAVDNLGNVYVTGGSITRATLEDYLTIKYSSEGDLLWERRYNGSGYSTDKATAIVVDNYGNVYVTGYSMMVYSYDYATIKYDTNGNQLWVRTYNGPGNNRDEAYNIALDNQGNVYVTGRSRGQNTSFDYATIKYDANGNELWVARYNGPENGDDVACRIVVDDWGNVYVTGYSYSVGTSFDYCTIKYIQTGGVKERNITKIEKEKFDRKGNLYDITGKLVKSKKLKKGVYFLKTEKENKKIVILK